MQAIRIGFVGCGKIAAFHADVLKHLGAEIVGLTARSVSERSTGFMAKYGVNGFYTSWEKMVEVEKPDGLWVLPGWDAIDKLLLPVLGSGVPTFFEKPVALSSKKIQDAIAIHGSLKNNVQIGYNRRFYDFIPVLKEKIKAQSLQSIEVHIPENSMAISDAALKDLLFIQNSSHILDLLLYVLDASVLDVHKVFKAKRGNGENNGYNALLSCGSVPVQLIANWNVASNFTLRFYFEDSLIELKPVEKMAVLKGFEIIDPTPETPIRLYNPKMVEQYFITGENAKFKPGFLGQTQNFIDTCILKNKENTIACDLTGALNVTALAESIMY